MTLEVDLSAQGEPDASGIVLLADVCEHGSVVWDGVSLPSGETVSASEFERRFPLIAPLSRFEDWARSLAQSERDERLLTALEDLRL